MPTMLVDSHEAVAKDWVISQLEGLGFSPRILPLSSGDYAWGTPVYGRVGVEAKDINDLIGSSETANANFIPRLDDELRRLIEDYGLPVLLAHDYARWEHFADGDDRWSIEAVDNLLAGRQMRGVLVVRARGTKGKHGLALRLASLYHYTQKPLLDRLLLPRRFSYMGPMSNRAEVVYTLLSRLGGFKNKRQMSEKLADTTSLKELFAWDVDQFRSSGFTKLMAGRVARLLEGEG